MSDSSKAVFLSYASQDADAARRICEALQAAGIEVWFDQSELVGGDAWDQKIRGQIKACALFVPVVSANTNARREGYFRREWKLAVERTNDMDEELPFLVPVVIDDTSETDAHVPEKFRQVQWTRLPGIDRPAHDQAMALFCSRVTALLGKATPATATPARQLHLATAGSTSTLPRSRVGGKLALVAATVSVTAVVIWQIQSRRPVPAPLARTQGTDSVPRVNSPAPAKSIAVLPFANLSDDKAGTAFFADGMQDELITTLSSIRELRVISRQSVEKFRQTAAGVREIGRDLRVGHVVEAAVRRAGETVRVSAKLIDVETEAPVWAKSYERDWRDVFAIQSELAAVITTALEVALSPHQKTLLARRPTDNPMAYDLYLQAREKLRANQRRGVETLLEAAVQLDPKFTAAWSQLCYVRAWQYDVNERTKELAAKARDAMEALARLAPASADALRAAGNYQYYCLREFQRAEESYKKVLELLPNDAEALNQLRALARRGGRWIEMLAYAQRYLEYDPGNIYVLGGAGLRTLYHAGRHYAEAMEAQRRIIRLQPDSLDHGFTLALIAFHATGSTNHVDDLFGGWTEMQANSAVGLRLRKQWAERTGAVMQWERLHALKPNDRPAPEKPGFNYAVLRAAAGDVAAVRAFLDNERTQVINRLAREPERARSWMYRAEIEALLGHRDDAVQSAEKAMQLEPESHDALRGPEGRSALAFAYAWTGDKDRAIAEYARLLRTVYGGQFVHEMKVNPRYAPLRSDQRFEALLNDPKNNAPLF